MDGGDRRLRKRNIGHKGAETKPKAIRRAPNKSHTVRKEPFCSSRGQPTHTMRRPPLFAQATDGSKYTTHTVELINHLNMQQPPEEQVSQRLDANHHGPYTANAHRPSSSTCTTRPHHKAAHHIPNHLFLMIILTSKLTAPNMVFRLCLCKLYHPRHPPMQPHISNNPINQYHLGDASMLSKRWLNN